MALKVSLILAGIALALLAIYGADVAAIQAGSDGFLPFNHMVRGLGLGGTSIILPIAAFFISRSEPSKALGAMILIAGVLIIVGGAVVIAGSSTDVGSAMESSRDVLAEAAPIVAAGVFIIALGAIKIIKS